jgi:hypothetical protein
LCHASPNAIGASQARLRDSSPVANGRRPKKWHSELMLKVDVMQDEHPHAPAPQQPVSRRQVPVEREAEAEREASPRRPEREGAADEAQVAVGEQVLRVAGRVGHVLAAEHPADVRVARARAAARATRSLIDVRAVRVARLVRDRCGACGGSATHSITGPSTAIEPSTASSARTARVVLKLRCVNNRWKPTVTPKPQSV